MGFCQDSDVKKVGKPQQVRARRKSLQAPWWGRPQFQHLGGEVRRNPSSRPDGAIWGDSSQNRTKQKQKPNKRELKSSFLETLRNRPLTWGPPISACLCCHILPLSWSTQLRFTKTGPQPSGSSFPLALSLTVQRTHLAMPPGFFPDTPPALLMPVPSKEYAGGSDLANCCVCLH